MKKQSRPVRHLVSLGLTLAALGSWFALPHRFWSWVEPTAFAVNFTVNETGDADDLNPGDGVCDSNNIRDFQCTLRAAIQEANATSALDTITFSIASGAKTISPTSLLPTITQPVIIDGTTQPGFAGSPLIELNGTSAGTSASGLIITAGNSTVKGLVINRFPNSGVSLQTMGTNTIQGNYIGTDVSGTSPSVGNQSDGISILNSSNNIIGGTTPALRNIISGNDQNGIFIMASPSATMVNTSSSNQILGNYIGTDKNGIASVGNHLDGVHISAAGVVLPGMNPGAAFNNTIGGTTPEARNVISGNVNHGVEFTGNGSQSNKIQGNFIGTDVNGTANLRNFGDGVLIDKGVNNTIGGTGTGARNVISSNSRNGIEILGNTAPGNKIQGNYIGTNSAGTAALGNEERGVRIENALDNLIGGTDGTTSGGPCTGACNVISQNERDGLLIVGNSQDNLVQGNYIGTDFSGNIALGNTSDGITISDAPNNTIGGTAAGSGNLISGNGGNGVFLLGAGTTGNQVLGNLIGTRIDGTSALGNNFSGVSISAASGNRIGRDPAASAGAGNVIGFNAIDGVTVLSGTNNVILSNSIFGNSRLGIDLNDDGVTPNDPGGGDGDTGANNLQNFPQITSAITSTGADDSSVRVTLNSTPNTRFIIELFANDTCDSSGNGEGKVFQGIRFGVMTDASGNAELGPINFNGLVHGQFITATATRQDAAGNPTDTSEFSPCVQVTAPGTLRFSQPAFSVIENTGAHSATITVARTGGSDGIVSVNFAASNGTATDGSDFTGVSGNLGFGSGEISRTFMVPIIDDSSVEGNETINLVLSSPTGGAALGSPSSVVLTIVDNDGAPTPTPTPIAGNVQFSSVNFNVNEDCTAIEIAVTRIGDTGSAVTVDYSTSDGSARQKTDYTISAGTLRFNAGDTSKSFQVLITEDSFIEGTETFTLALSNPTGGTALGSPSTASISIIDDPSEPASNPIDNANIFAHQHYHDFLNREPDASGLAFWTGQITSCGTDAQCIEIKRINVSAAFFLSIEFQETGYLVYRIYKSAFGNLPGKPVPVRYNEFLRDTQEIGRDVQVGIGDWQTQLENNKQAFALQFVQRSDFQSAYPASLTADQFVNQLDFNAGGVLSADEKATLVAVLGSTPANPANRAMVLRSVAEDHDLKNAEFNKAFVLMQYFGYLRRNPDDPPEPGLNFDGYNFWLNKLNQFNGNFINAEMVKAFIVATEYRQRFGT